MDACSAARLEALKIQAHLNRCTDGIAALSSVHHHLDDTLVKLCADLRLTELGTTEVGRGRPDRTAQPEAHAI